MIEKILGNQPFFTNKDIDNILKEIRVVLEEGKLTQGKHLARFESLFSESISSKYALGVNSGGTALEIALRAINVEGSEVIVPTDTFMATPNSVVLAGGTPIFVDIDPDSFAIDIEDLKTKITDKTKGIIIVYMFGIIPDNLDEIINFCKEYNLFLMEDAAHAHGSTYNGVSAGNIGDIGCFSFYATKVLTSGEGGIISTNNIDFYESCKSIRGHGKSLTSSQFIRLGNNYRLSEIPSILGSYQVKRLAQFVKHRNNISQIYTRFFSNLDYVKIFKPTKKTVYSYWRYPLLVKTEIDRVKIQRIMDEEHNFRITWMYDPPCHLQPYYMSSRNYKEGDFPNAESLLPKLICLPTHLNVTEATAHRIAKTLDNIIQSEYL